MVEIYRIIRFFRDKKHKTYKTKKAINKCINQIIQIHKRMVIFQNIYIVTNKGKTMLEKGQVIYHKDGNKNNDFKDNLIIMTKA